MSKKIPGHRSPVQSPIQSLEARRLLSSSVYPILKDEGGSGLTGEYFAGTTFQTPVVIRQDTDINFTWPAGRPDQDIPAGGFSAQWAGQIEAPITADFTFYTNSDSGTQLTINGAPVISNLAARTASVSSGTIQLTVGQKYSIVLDYVSRAKGTSRIQLLWSSPTITSQLVSGYALFPATESLPASQPLLGSYYEGDNFNQLLMTRADPAIDFNWGTGVPDSAIPQNTPFSVIWTGDIKAPVTGKYTFESITDDGVRLFINGVEIIKDWNVHSAQADLGKITLQAGQVYSIKMEYFQDGVGHTSAKLLWALPGQGKVERFVHFIYPAPATPVNLAVTTASSTQLDVSWNDVPNETGFTLERAAANSGDFVAIATLAQGVTTHDDMGLTPATAYQYEIIASNANASSPPSVPASGTTDPGTVTATATSSTNSTATLSFTTPGSPSGYTIERSLNSTSGFTPAGNATASPFTDTGLSSATTYYYQVIATNSVGTSLPSNVVSVTTTTAAPVNLTAAVQSATQINLAWNDVAGEAGFVVQESANGTTGWAQIGTTPTGDTAFTVSGLTPATTYYFRVLATDAGGNSAPSNVANGTTSAANPTYATLTTIFGLTGNGRVYSIDTATGVATQIGTLSFGTNAAGRDTYTGNFYYISAGSTGTVSISSWNPNDGVNTVITPSLTLSGPVGQAAFRSDGDFFVTTDVGDLYEINSDNGVATPNGNIHVNGNSLPTNDGDIAFAPNNDLYIETNRELYKITAAAVNASTGTTNIVTATDIGPTGTANLQLAFGQNGILYGTDAAGQLYTINPATAATTPVGTPSGVDMGDLASVPLYATLSVAQSASTFVAGGTGTYTLTVNNAGPNTTVGTMTLIDTLPTGVTYVSGTGNGWTFSVSGQTVTMTYTVNTPAGSSAPPVTLNVSIAPTVTGSVTNSVNVSTNIFTTNTTAETGTLVTPVSG